MSRRHPPGYSRYFQALLSNLTKPSVWGSAIFVSVVGMGIYQYWNNPDLWTKGKVERENASNVEESSFSDEEKAMIADIDNLPVLLNDNANGDILPNIAIATTKTQKVEDKLNNQDKKSTEQIKSPSTFIGTNSVSTTPIENPFLKQVENLLIGNNLNLEKNSNFLGTSTLNVDYLNPGLTTNTPAIGTGLNHQNITATSPLKTAIEKSIQSNPAITIPQTTVNNLNPNSPNPSVINNSQWQSPGLNSNNNLPRVNSYNPPLPTPQSNGVNYVPGYVQPNLNPQTNISPTNNLNINQPNNQGYIQPGLTNQPLPSAITPTPTTYGIPQPNNNTGEDWRSQYNRIQNQVLGDN